MRGEGRIFRRRRSGFWWCEYYLHGKQFRESTKETDEKKAWKYLERRLDEVGADRIGAKKFVGPQAERILVSCGITELWDRKPNCDCLCCALERDYRLRDKASAQNLSNLKRLRTDFALKKASALSADNVDSYIEGRISEGDAPASVNRVTQLLRQSFNLATQRKRLASAPFIRRLSEAGNVRRGYSSEAEVRCIVEHLPEYLRDFTLWGYETGMRKGEIRSLGWADLDGDRLHLRAENAKNGEGRFFPLEGELADIIERRRAARQLTRPDGTVSLSRWIFHRDGDPVGDFRKAWATDCRLAGVERRLFHDLRRTAVRDMRRAGISETVAMSISGHKTRSMFDRYNISDDRDQREALRATQNYRRQQRENVAVMPKSK